MRGILLLLACTLLSCGFLSDEGRIDALLSRMTLEEKVAFIGGYNDFYIRGYEHLNIPEVRFADGPVGVRNLGPSTSYPASIALAASFDRNLARRQGRAIAMEARAGNVHVMLGPAMNIHRAPFCGRNFEYLGEDPFLAGQMAVQYIQGMQGEGVMATAKHYVANNQDYDRHNVSSDMDERTLREIYLPAFKASVEQGHVASIMTSYNLINGVHASQHGPLINDILKGEWGFDGFVMSDWTSCYDGLACAVNGLDLEMPFGKLMNPDTLTAAVKSGRLDETIIDDKIRRIFRAYYRFGLFKHPDISEGYRPDTEFIRQTALDVARGGIVLLKNESDMLPLHRGEIQSIAVIGPNGDPAVTGGGGSSKVEPLNPVSVYDAVKQKAGQNVNVVFEPGVFVDKPLPREFFQGSEFYIYENDRKTPGLEAEIFSNIGLEGEPQKRTTLKNLNLTRDDLVALGAPAENFSVRFTCYFTPEESVDYLFGVSGDDGYRLYIDGKRVVNRWVDQPETSREFVKRLRSGREYKIELEYYQRLGGAIIRLAAKKQTGERLSPKEYLPRALDAARSADRVILAVGFGPRTESEGFDRTFELPHDQDRLIRKVAAVNPNTVVVLNAGGNVDMNAWVDRVPALVHAWYPGEAGNQALAEILFGEVNPSGKLPASFEKRWKDNPAYGHYFDEDGDLKTFYHEGIFLGYRFYDQSNIRPRFPFGHGLSYTTFAIGNARVNRKTFGRDDDVRVLVDVTNTGEMDGAETVQLYVADVESSLPRPVKELKDFDKVWLAAGETKTVEFTLNRKAFAFYHPEKGGWIAEPGEFRLLLGSSSGDIRAEVKVTLK